MPSYVKFMKKILTNKRHLNEHEIVNHLEECSAILQNKISPKLRDLGSFTILGIIGDTDFNKALCYLGASINSMLFSILFRNYKLVK